MSLPLQNSSKFFFSSLKPLWETNATSKYPERSTFNVTVKVCQLIAEYLKEFGFSSNLLQSIMFHDTLHNHEKAHINEQVSDLFTDWTKITDVGCHFS